jgi:hypothetical protein
MKKLYYSILTVVVCSGLNLPQLMAQSLPVGTPVLEDYYRRKQLLGELDSTVSFTSRPLFPTEAFKVHNAFDPDSSLREEGWLKFDGPLSFANGYGKFQILPFSLQQQYNSDHPYGWNDGAMIPANGYQSLITGGFFAKIGPLSIQLQPEFVYAANKSFDGFAYDRSDAELRKYYGMYNGTDLPERFGQGAYNKVLWGQSSIRLTFGPASIGLSNENLWWGPGMRNSLLMSNTASGFKHLTLNTVRPIHTYIGSFEAQIIGGRLDATGLSPLEAQNAANGQDLFTKKRDDWRYLSAFNISYQPKWVPGLFIGFTRAFHAYQSDLSGLKDYVPFFTPFQKVNTDDGDPFDRDQLTSLYARWVFVKAKAEVYFEYGLNDNAYNIRDFIGSPDHSRAYLFGVRKLIPLKYRNDEFISVNAEFTQMSQSADRLVRDAGGWYYHGRVRDGYTNKGQLMGAGIGPGGNLQSLEVSWVKDLKRLGLSLERYEHNLDFYNEYLGDFKGQSRRWVDFAIAAQGEWNYGNLLFNAKLQGIRSMNYQWRLKDYDPTSSRYYIPHNGVFNFHGEFGVSYRF